MYNGNSVLLWISQNGYTITKVAEQIGYTRPRLSQALNQDQITFHLAGLLDREFGLLVIPTSSLTLETDMDHERGSHTPIRGRIAGSRVEGSSKLDEHLEDISALLDAGVPLSQIAERYGTTKSNLHDRLKSRGLREQRSPS